MTRDEAQTRMYELNWQRDRIREEIDEANKRFKRVIKEGWQLLSEYPTLSLKAPEQVELPCGSCKKVFDEKAS